MLVSQIRHFLQLRFPRQLLFVQARLSPEGLFGLYLTIGTVFLVGAVWIFGGISEDLITGDPLVLVDAFISEWFRLHSNPAFTKAMQLASVIGSTETVCILSALMGCLLLWKRQWHGLLGLVLAVAGGMLLNLLLKNLFGRARPGWADPLMALTDPSFPSGHTMMATIIYGFTRSRGRAEPDVSRRALPERRHGRNGGRHCVARALSDRSGSIAPPPQPVVAEWTAVNISSHPTAHYYRGENDD